MLKGKTVILGVTGSIAAYKIAGLASMLVKQHCDVHVIMTRNATNFIHPITFETLTNHKCLVDTFDRNFEFHIAHVNLAQKADFMLIAPASANVIGKIASGIADDMLTTTVVACHAPIAISPAMNTNMYEDAIVQDNLQKLQKFGYQIIQPAMGMLACRAVGAGKMPEPEELFSYIEKEIAYPKDLTGKKVLVTAGPTQEAIDPVRFITNHSTGKMGYALAKAAMLRGAEVTLVSGPTNLPYPPFVSVLPVVSAKEMFEAVRENMEQQDIIIKAAAVADFTPKQSSNEKIKKTAAGSSLEMESTTDILQYIGMHRRENQYVCGFSMETENMIENSKKKLEKKKIDMIVANNLKESGAGFGTDTNIVTILTKKGEIQLPIMSKENVANAIIDYILDKNF